MRHQLGFVFPATLDGSSSSLWLNTVQTRYYAPGSTSTFTDSFVYDFDGEQFDNRVDWNSNVGVKKLDKRRVTSIFTPVGGRIDVHYATDYAPSSSRHCPTTGSGNSSTSYWNWYNTHTKDKWDQNGWDCYPVLFDPDGDGGVEAGFGIFHKYVVESVELHDLVGGAPSQSFAYTYAGSPAWAYQDSILLSRGEGAQTWNQYRGYAKVSVATGSGSDNSTTVTQFYRGMNGDWNANGTTKSVTVHNDVTGNDPVDYRSRAGMVLSRRVLNDAGQAMSQHFTSYTVPVSEDGPGVHDSWWVRPDYTQSEERVLNAAGAPTSSWKKSRETYTYDAARRVETTTVTFDLADPAETVCTETFYVTSVGSEPSWGSLLTDSLWGSAHYQWYESDIRVHDGDCSGVLTARTQYGFDGLVPGSAQHPTDGNVTEVRTWTTSGTFTSATAVYDMYGRKTEATSPSQEPLTAAARTRWQYSALGASPRTVTTTRDAATGTDYSQTVTSEVAFGQPTRLTDEDGLTTLYRYDPTGRLIAGWAPRQLGGDASIGSGDKRTVQFSLRGRCPQVCREGPPQRGVERVDAPR